jgi:hypothetical protein
VQHLKKKAFESIKASIDLWRTLKPRAQLRSWSELYNCMGLVFGSRRTHIDIVSLRFILKEDGYRRLSGPDEANLGDVVVYADSVPRHVGIVARIDVNLARGLRELFVISKWGEDGEYLHEVKDVPELYGSPIEYWTDREVIDGSFR